MGTTLAGHILTTRGFIDGTIVFADDGRIATIDGTPVAPDAVRAATKPIVIPGFIDLHVHGGGGRDTMEGGDAAARIAQVHARHGTTSLLATTMTAPLHELRVAFEGVRDCMAAPARSGARLLGVHLEGPFINAGMLGAQPDFARPLSFEEVAQLDAIAPVKLVTIAPEPAGNMAQIEALAARGFRVQLGHTAGTYEEGVEALQRGASGFTHLFNAMTPLNHRMPGMVGAALAHARFAEIIPDLLHVHAGAIRAALRAIPCLYCVTDSTAASGMPDGDYRLGRQSVTKCLGGVRLADGRLAGSALTMDMALRNLVDKIGLSLEDASARVSTYAADRLGSQDRGRLAPGAWADAAVLDRDLQVQAVFVEGLRVGDAD